MYHLRHVLGKILGLGNPYSKKHYWYCGWKGLCGPGFSLRILDIQTQNRSFGSKCKSLRYKDLKYLFWLKRYSMFSAKLVLKPRGLDSWIKPSRELMSDFHRIKLKNRIKFQKTVHPFYWKLPRDTSSRC